MGHKALGYLFIVWHPGTLTPEDVLGTSILLGVKSRVFWVSLRFVNSVCVLGATQRHWVTL